MQNIIDKIIEGELSQKQLIESLVEYHEESTNEYNEACDVVERNQLQINKLEARAREREENIKTIESAALETLGYTKQMQSDNTRLLAQLEESKAAVKENKRLKAQNKRQAEANKKAVARAEKLTKEFSRLNKEISTHKSDIARLRLTGQKNIGKYSFTIFPSKISGSTNEKKVVLVAHNNQGCMKCVTVEDGEIVQPYSHTFKFDEDQESFIRDFHSIAKQDGFQFTDRVLRLVN